eukprot:jgi/Mesvir1/13367/Mv05852-RA.2
MSQSKPRTSSAAGGPVRSKLHAKTSHVIVDASSLAHDGPSASWPKKAGGGVGAAAGPAPGIPPPRRVGAAGTVAGGAATARRAGVGDDVSIVGGDDEAPFAVRVDEVIPPVKVPPIPPPPPPPTNNKSKSKSKGGSGGGGGGKGSGGGGGSKGSGGGGGGGKGGGGGAGSLPNDRGAVTGLATLADLWETTASLNEGRDALDAVFLAASKTSNAVAPTGFWKMVEPYFGFVTRHDLSLLDPSEETELPLASAGSGPHAAPCVLDKRFGPLTTSLPYMDIPPLGEHYSKVWEAMDAAALKEDAATTAAHLAAPGPAGALVPNGTAVVAPPAQAAAPALAAAVAPKPKKPSYWRMEARLRESACLPLVVTTSDPRYRASQTNAAAPDRDAEDRSPTGATATGAPPSCGATATGAPPPSKRKPTNRLLDSDVAMAAGTFSLSQRLLAALLVEDQPGPPGDGAGPAVAGGRGGRIPSLPSANNSAGLMPSFGNTVAEDGPHAGGGEGGRRRLLEGCVSSGALTNRGGSDVPAGSTSHYEGEGNGVANMEASCASIDSLTTCGQGHGAQSKQAARGVGNGGQQPGGEDGTVGAKGHKRKERSFGPDEGSPATPTSGRVLPSPADAADGSQEGRAGRARADLARPSPAVEHGWCEASPLDGKAGPEEKRRSPAGNGTLAHHLTATAHNDPRGALVEAGAAITAGSGGAAAAGGPVSEEEKEFAERYASLGYAERLQAELLSVGLPHGADASTLATTREDDEICVEMRACHRKLQEQRRLNNKRKHALRQKVLRRQSDEEIWARSRCLVRLLEMAFEKQLGKRGGNDSHHGSSSKNKDAGSKDNDGSHLASARSSGNLPSMAAGNAGIAAGTVSNRPSTAAVPCTAAALTTAELAEQVCARLDAFREAHPPGTYMHAEDAVRAEELAAGGPSVLRRDSSPSPPALAMVTDGGATGSESHDILGSQPQGNGSVHGAGRRWTRAGLILGYEWLNAEGARWGQTASTAARATPTRRRRRSRHTVSLQLRPCRRAQSSPAGEGWRWRASGRRNGTRIWRSGGGHGSGPP